MWSATTGSQPSAYFYGYDANGNRTSTAIGGNATTATYNAANEMTDWTTGQTISYTYDPNGNEVSSSNGLAFQYNAKNQTTSITGIFGAPLAMGYADSGQAERTSAGGSTYENSSLGIGSETKAGATTYYTRTPGGHLVSQRNANGAWEYYLFDGLGSVVGLVDGSGNLVARYTYDPYGQTVTRTGTAADGNPFRYTGAGCPLGGIDSTGLYKVGARYYDPARGRFTQLDPLGNGYSYTGDNPVNFTDPTGLCYDAGQDPVPCEPVGGPNANPGILDPLGPDLGAAQGRTSRHWPDMGYRCREGLARI